MATASPSFITTQEPSQKMNNTLELATEFAPDILADIPAPDPFEEIIAKHGEPFILSAKGKPINLNPMLAPAVYASRNDVIHDGLTRSFYEYNPTDGIWSATPPDTMRGKLSDLIFEIGNDLEQPNITAKERSDSKLVGAVNNLRTLTDGRFDDRPSGFIHCENGMLDVATGILRPFDPSFKSRNKTPFRWDENAKCPRFLSELLEPAIDAHDIALIQLYIGMALMGRNLAQRLLLLTGTAGGGKSQFVIAIEGLVGRLNCAQLRTEMLAERFETERLVGKTLLLGRDVPGNFLQSKGAHVLKALTGGDSLDTERKGVMGGHTIDGEFSAIITSNSRLRVRLDGDTDAWRRRLLIVNYCQPKTEKPIPDFGRALLNEEGAGILRWAVDGARRLLDLGYKIPVSADQQARVDSLLFESDALRTFVGQELIVGTGSDLTTSEIVEMFFAYCDARHWKTDSVRNIERDLPDIMMELHRAAKSNSLFRDEKAAKGYRGIKFRQNGTVGTADSNPYVC